MINVEGKKDSERDNCSETEKLTTQKQYCQKYYSARPAGLIYEKRKSKVVFVLCCLAGRSKDTAMKLECKKSFLKVLYAKLHDLGEPTT